MTIADIAAIGAHRTGAIVDGPVASGLLIDGFQEMIAAPDGDVVWPTVPAARRSRLIASPHASSLRQDARATSMPAGESKNDE